MYCRVLVKTCMSDCVTPVFVGQSMSELKVCCHPVFSRSSVSVGVGVRDVEAVISGLSP